jgi:hypothetical protein
MLNGSKGPRRRPLHIARLQPPRLQPVRSGRRAAVLVAAERCLIDSAIDQDELHTCISLPVLAVHLKMDCACLLIAGLAAGVIRRWARNARTPWPTHQDAPVSSSRFARGVQAHRIAKM